MAASDSEDFESADEDLEQENKERLASNRLKERNEIDKSEKSAEHNDTESTKVDENHSENDSGSQQNVISEATTKNIDKNKNKGDGSKSNIKVSNIGKKSVKEDRQRRQTGQTETKSQNSINNSSAKRLGSKLNTKPLETSDSKTENIEQETRIVEKRLEEDIIVSADKNKHKSSNDAIDHSKTADKKESQSKDVLTKSEEEAVLNDGWDLEDGFEMNNEFILKPKDNEDFEKELFPVLNKLSNLSTTNSNVNSNTCKLDEKRDSSASNWGGWSGWGVGSLLSTATESVSTLTSHVSAGLNTVLETGLGAPDPEVLAQVLQKEVDAEKRKDSEENKPEVVDANPGISATGIGSGLSQLMSGVSQLSNKVISGGLDTLETLGKKTMEVLQEGDPGLRKKRALFFQDDDKPVLSQMLREAKENAEKSDKMEEDKQAARRVHFETLFDDYHGLVHLEALEMLSKQCQLKIHTILLGMSGDALKELRETLEQVKELCELSDEEDEECDKDDDNDSDFLKKVTGSITMMGVQVPYSRLIEVSECVTKWLNSESAKTSKPTQIHEKAVSSMAEFTSVSMETFHRMAELLLIKQRHSTADEAESLVQLTGTLCARVSRIATKFTSLLSENDESKSNNVVITTIFLESANSSSYIQDACRLIVPVLQVGASI